MPTDSRSQKVAAFALTVTIFLAALTGGFATHAAFSDSETATVTFGVAAVNSGTAATNTGTAATNTGTAAVNSDPPAHFGGSEFSSQIGDDDGGGGHVLPITAVAVGFFAPVRTPR